MIGYLFLYASILYPESQSLIGIIILGKAEQRSVIVNGMREQIQSNLRYIHLKMLLGLNHYNVNILTICVCMNVTLCYRL